MDKTLNLRQIILVTDGESNVGCNPIDVARKAHKMGITVSTIGIINDNKKEEPMGEIQNIAHAGGGIFELTDISNLSRTVAMATQKSVYKTIEEAVHKELKEILGTGIKEMHPESRRKIIDVIDKIGNEVNLKCCIVIDCSGSMSNKINIAKSSILNLLRLLNGRKGKTEIGVITFPGDNETLYRIVCDFTDDYNNLEMAMKNIKTGGTTPTGPALEGAIDILTIEEENKSLANHIV